MSPLRTPPDALAGQVAIVTGGGRGIGQVVALALAEAGAAVTITARTAAQVADTAQRIEAAGGRARAVVGDVTDPADVDRTVAETVAAFGPPTILVNNAGIFGPIGPTWEVDPDQWWRGLESHVRGALLYVRAVMPRMIAGGSGRIINVASRSGAVSRPYTSSYACAKALVIRFTEQLAAEALDLGVRVFAIYPGIVQTAMTDELIESAAGRRWLPHTGEERKGLWVPAERAARLCVFLASGQGDGLTGRFFGVNDDVADLARRAEEIQQRDLYTLRLRTDACG
jgi:NAD(P)-dependent dehydrogenase (short-subunit alcohol dehydrogenase family)